jgi:nicotinate-nucleotide adenylyltransferase
MRLGLFGGCFDPIHCGHINPVRTAQEKLALDRVVFLPTAVPPHKPGRQFAPPHARFAMAELALLKEPGMVVSPLELTPDRPFYTVDSLRHFRDVEPEAELFLFFDDTATTEIYTWRDWTEIPKLATLAVLTRPDWHWTDLRDGLPQDLVDLGESERVQFIRNHPVPVSATEIRARLAKGQEISTDSVPGLVLEYIRKYSLYQ